nr:MAG TPA: hypothetical protein [Bacteriophage sp.]
MKNKHHADMQREYLRILPELCLHRIAYKMISP